MPKTAYQELLPGIFCIEVPMPHNPLRTGNAYLVRQPGRCLLIDNGFNTPESETALRAALHQLNVDLSHTDFFLTHLHSDHCGLTMRLRGSFEGSIYCSAEDGDRLNDSIQDSGYWSRVARTLQRNGLAEDEAASLLRAHPGKIFACDAPLPFTPVEEGHRLTYGEYVFRVIAVPGHTPGHLALLEENTQVLVAGDHVLSRITPNITCWPDVDDALGDYLRSLEKVLALRPSRIFCGHRRPVEAPKARLEELRDHHSARLREVESILRGREPLSACDVAARMHWSLKGGWQHFAVAQRCFAVGEALSHLLHLYHAERADFLCAARDGISRYTLLPQAGM